MPGLRDIYIYIFDACAEESKWMLNARNIHIYERHLSSICARISFAPGLICMNCALYGTNACHIGH